MRIFESSIPASHLKTDFLCTVGIWIYREGTLKRKPFSGSPILRYKALVASKRLCYGRQTPAIKLETNEIGDHCFFSDSFHHCHRLTVSPQNSHIEPKSQCASIWRWCLWEAIRSWGGALTNEMMILSFLCPSSTALLVSLSNHTLQPWEHWVFQAVSPAQRIGPWGRHRVHAPSSEPPEGGTLDSSCTLKVPLGHTWIIAKIDFPEAPSQGHFWNLRAVALYSGLSQTLPQHGAQSKPEATEGVMAVQLDSPLWHTSVAQMLCAKWFLLSETSP